MSSKRRKRPLKWAANLAVAVAGWCLLTVCVGLAFGLTLVLTPSIQPWLLKAEEGRVQVGDYLRFCPPAAPAFDHLEHTRYARCPETEFPFVKPVVAVAGQKVELHDEAVVVDGVPIPHSATLYKTSQGQALTPYPRGSYTVRRGEAWVISTFATNSLDSRYFGPVRVSTSERLIPLLNRSIPE